MIPLIHLVGFFFAWKEIMSGSTTITSPHVAHVRDVFYCLRQHFAHISHFHYLIQVDVTVLPANEGGGGLGDLAQSLILPAALFAGLFFLSRRGGGGQMPGGMGGGGQNPMGFGKAKSEIQMTPDTGVNFDDVAGCDGAKLELVEVVDFLKQPELYNANGCRIPRGVILDGPPGTGKTLLAKAVAGEAGVPFISISASEFVEMFVGVGASRVRDIFAQAKKNAPCIILIDEIDAV